MCQDFGIAVEACFALLSTLCFFDKMNGDLLGIIVIVVITVLPNLPASLLGKGKKKQALPEDDGGKKMEDVTWQDLIDLLSSSKDEKTEEAEIAEASVGGPVEVETREEVLAPVVVTEPPVAPVSRHVEVPAPPVVASGLESKPLKAAAPETVPEDVGKRSGGRIDKRKLVIYSEIMNPVFDKFQG